MTTIDRRGAVLPPVVAEGYRRGAVITRQHGTTYFWGARLLPPESRRHVHALYALARTADDIVDLAPPRTDRAAALAAYERGFVDAVRGGVSTDPVLAAAATTVRAQRLDLSVFGRFFAAMRTDLTRSSYATFEDLLGYMDGSAAAIGEMMLPVLHPDPETAERVRPAAQALGLAFQLTNFLRDVGEDLDRGRVYLPVEDLEHFGADPTLRRVDDAWRAMMRFQVARNRRLYDDADRGIAALPLRARRCVVTARLLYARILRVIEANDHDVFTRRARVPTPRKAALATRVAASRAPERLLVSDAAASAWPDDDSVVLLDDAGRPCGTAAKSAVHHDHTPLHLGFSCYVFDAHGRLLVSRRAESKTSFPAVATNTACGHPRPGESVVEAARRRCRYELGLEIADVRVVLPDFAYTARSGSVTENERCPVLVARAVETTGTTSLRPRPDEVAEVAWVDWAAFRDDVVRRTWVAPSGRAWPISPWCQEQVPLLAALGPDPLAWRADG